VSGRPIALVRGVPASFGDALTAVPVEPPLDVAVARSQHDEYVAALEAGGFDVHRVPVDDDAPDSCFVEDAAVVIGSRALVTRPGHPDRRVEVEPVAAAVAAHVPVHRMAAPATLDGGDVLIAGDVVLVGLSARTNREGARAVAAIAEPQGFRVRPVEVAAGLHLKSGLTALDDTTLLWHPESCAPDALDGFDLIEVADEPPGAANVVRLADGGILAPAGSEAVAAVTASGRHVVELDVSEFVRADGGVTCLSIRLS